MKKGREIRGNYYYLKINVNMSYYFSENTFHRVEKMWRASTGNVKVKILDITTNESRAKVKNIKINRKVANLC